MDKDTTQVSSTESNLSEIVTQLRITVAKLSQIVEDQHRPPCVHLLSFQDEVRGTLKTSEKLKYVFLTALVTITVGLILRALGA